MAEATPSGPRRRTNYRRGLETQALVLQAAEQTIISLGFNRASSREIVRRSGVTWGVIQHHFGSYEAVLLAVVQRALDLLRVTLSEVDIPDGDTETKVAHVADIVWDYYSRPHYLSYLEIYLNLLRDPATSEATRLELVKVNAEIETLWQDLTQRLFGHSRRFDSLQRLLFGTLRGLAVSRWLNEGRLNFEAERELFVRAISAYLDSTDGAASLGGRVPRARARKPSTGRSAPSP